MGKREPCATIEEALPTIGSVDEMTAFIWALKEFRTPVTTEQWAAIARRMVDLKKQEAGKA